MSKIDKANWDRIDAGDTVLAFFMSLGFSFLLALAAGGLTLAFGSIKMAVGLGLGCLGLGPIPLTLVILYYGVATNPARIPLD